MSQISPYALPLTSADIPKLRSALLRYRIMAYVVGTMLVILVCVGLPLKYIGHDSSVVTWTGMPHGFLYMILLITAYDLGSRARWGWKQLLSIAVAGTVPFLSFVAEHFARKDVNGRIAAIERDDTSTPPASATS